MKAQMMKFWKDEDGATAIEYGLIAGLMVAVIVLAFGALGTGIGTLFDNIVTALTTSTT